MYEPGNEYIALTRMGQEEKDGRVYEYWNVIALRCIGGVTVAMNVYA